MGIFCGGLNAYCMRIWPLFLRTSGSSGVLKALLLERNRQLSCNPKKKKKKKKIPAPCIVMPMRRCPDLSAVLASLYDKPLLGPKPNQLLVFKRGQQHQPHVGQGSGSRSGLVVM